MLGSWNGKMDCSVVGYPLGQVLEEKREGTKLETKSRTTRPLQS
jgi:hypothetical protein